jgi:hypothetical protein
MYTFYDLYYGICQDINNTTSGVQAKAKQWSNDAIAEFLLLKDWYFMEKELVTHIEAGSLLVGLPEEVGVVRSVYIRDRTMALRQKDWGDLDQLDHDKDTTGTPSRYAIAGHGMLSLPVSSLSLVSGSASDTTQTATVYGTSRGRMLYETVSLTGTTAVSTTNSYDAIEKITLSAACAGAITIISNEGNVTNCTIPAGSTDSTSVTITNPGYKIYMKSSSTADGTTYAARITGIDSQYGTTSMVDVTLNGTSYTTITSERFRSIHSVEVSSTANAVPAGMISVYAGETAADGGDLITRIRPGSFTSQHLQLAIQPVVTTRTALIIKYRYNFPRLSQDRDALAPIPAKYFPIVKAAGKVKGFMALGFPNYAAMEHRLYGQLLQQVFTDSTRYRTPVEYGDSADTPDELGYPGAVSEG